MPNALLWLGPSLLLAATGHGAAAFRGPGPAAGGRAHVRTRPSAPCPLRASQFDDQSGDGGYEVRGDQPQGGGPRTTFGAENVPVDQRPSNEYLNLVGAPTFGWASQESGDGGLALRLAVLYAVLYGLVCWPISGATWVEDGFLLQKVTAANVGALSVVFVLVLRLYSGWGYIGARLRDKNIEYEESGWYDGAIEEKGAAEKARDLFLYRSEVRPVEARLQKVALATGLAWVASCVALNVAVGSKPVFDQYDAKMLNALQYDDKVAAVVREQSNGRPTYCDNRYYRTVANGGQGCD